MISEVRVITLENVAEITACHLDSIDEIGSSVVGKRGMRLLESLKREQLDHGPYRGVTLFEAAYRIMSDMVILRGVHWLLKNREFTFHEYTVELGNEDRNGFDIRASADGATLVGEAFNVAPSFYQIKKRSAVRKLIAKGHEANHRIVLVNSDAVTSGYLPKFDPTVRMYTVDIVSGEARRRC